DEQILEFACLFTSSIADAKGRFRVLSDALVPIDLVRSDASSPRIGVPSPEVLERAAASTRVRLPLLYDTSLLLAEFSVFPDGAVRMVSDEQLVPKLPVDREVLARDTRSFARLRAQFTPLFQRLGQGADDDEAAISIAKLFATGFGEGGYAIDDDAAQRWLLHLDEGRRAAVAYDIGQAFALEKDAPEDVEFALLWFARAADWGHASAAYDLGAWLVKSNSPLRRESGLVALQRAARADEVRSLGLLGRAQIYGYHGLDVDIESGLALLERAAELGSADSSYLLGLFYAHGTHVSRDPIRASALFAQAEPAHPITGYFRGVLRANGYGGAENLTEVRLYEQAAVREVAEAEVVLALRHRSGLGLEGVDLEKALRWSRRAFERQSRRGGLVLALLLAESEDPKSHEEAREVRATVAGWPEPAPQLATYLDPVFLEEELPGSVVSVEQVLRAWTERVEQELDRLLER
ncbi:MAG: tetratricopeptide repeat protein, partial [Planctomycetota bacterium]